MHMPFENGLNLRKAYKTCISFNSRCIIGLHFSYIYSLTVIIGIRLIIDFIVKIGTIK